MIDQEMVEAETLVWAIVSGLEAQSHEGSAGLDRRIIEHGVGRVASALIDGRQLIEPPGA